MSEAPTRHLFRVEEFDALGQLEAFSSGPRLELVEGEIVEMAPIGPDHASAWAWINTCFVSRLGDRAALHGQSALRLGDFSLPQPDLLVLVPPLARYRRRHPVADDVLLLVEIANSSLSFDLGVKVPLYARTGVAEVWVVDLQGEAVIVHRDPSPEGYRTVTSKGRGEQVRPAAFPDVEVAVDELLG